MVAHATHEPRKSLSRMRLIAAALVVSLGLGTSGCGRTGWELFGAMVEVAACIAVEALILSVHDAHYHSAHCGHRYVVYEQHPVYYYQDRWEYYDAPQGHWYYYPDGVPLR